MKNRSFRQGSILKVMVLSQITLLLFALLSGCDELVDSGNTPPVTAVPTTTVTTPAVSPTPTALAVTPDPGSLVLAQSMGVGWNLGNTLESCGAWIDNSNVGNYETAWGNPVTTQAMIHGIAQAGFKSVRIPVAWSNMMANDYTINPALLSRVKVLVDWVQAEGMVALVDLHWDSGWIAGFSTQWDACMAKYVSIWTQVSNYFKDEDLTLVFESLNEEASWGDVWNYYSNSGSKETAYRMINQINQKFVDILRAGGGNNPERYLLLAGYETNIDKTCDPLFLMPSDPAGRCMVSIHYYDPPTFAILSADASWGTNATTWGTSAEIQYLKDNMAKLKNRFIDHGIPVIMGEFGCPTTNKEAASVARFLSTVAKEARAAGVCPMLWDAGAHFNRSSLQFNSPAVLGDLQTAM